MFNEAGLAAILQFGALGLLGFFMYRFDQSYRSQTEFQQLMTVKIMEIVKENTDAQRQAATKSEAICTALETNRTMEKEEHEALMTQHEVLMKDHRHITKKLASA